MNGERLTYFARKREAIESALEASVNATVRAQPEHPLTFISKFIGDLERQAPLPVLAPQPASMPAWWGESSRILRRPPAVVATPKKGETDAAAGPPPSLPPSPPPSPPTSLSASPRGQLELSVKPFGKNGVRLLWSRDKREEEVTVEWSEAGTAAGGWRPHAQLESVARGGALSGTLTVKEISLTDTSSPAKSGTVEKAPAPSALAWRLHSLVGRSEAKSLRSLQSSKSPPQVLLLQLDDSEIAFNMLQW